MARDDPTNAERQARYRQRTAEREAALRNADKAEIARLRAALRAPRDDEALRDAQATIARLRAELRAARTALARERRSVQNPSGFVFSNRQYRRLLQVFHPDGAAPDVAMFRLLKDNEARLRERSD
jgi:hypothetical protein